MTAERRADLAFFGAIAIGVAFVLIAGPLERRLEMERINDFSGFWAGARAVVLGVDPYDRATWYATTERLGTQSPDSLVYGYLPWVALALAPLAVLPVETGAWIWMAASIALAAAGLRALLRDRLPGHAPLHGAFGLTLLLSQPAYHALVLGQWAFMLLAATCAALVWLRRAPVRAGLAALVLLAKPQLGVWAAAGLAHAALRDLAARRALVAAGAGAAVALGISVLVFPGWIGAWTAEIPTIRLAHPASLATALGDLIGPAGPTLAAGLVLTAAAVATRFTPASDAAFALWLALSVAGAPYAWSYDHLLMLAPIVLAVGVLKDRAPRRAIALAAFSIGTLILASPLLYGVAVMRHRESFSAFVPAALFAVTAVALWPVRRA